MLDCFLVLVVLQIARIIIKNILLSVLNFTDINLNIANIISIMIVGISVFMFLRGSSLFNPAGNRLTEMANKYYPVSSGNFLSASVLPFLPSCILRD